MGPFSLSYASLWASFFPTKEPRENIPYPLLFLFACHSQQPVGVAFTFDQNRSSNIAIGLDGFPSKVKGRCIIGKSAPKPPDPRETAAASTSTNVGTAIANAFMQNANQVTPNGNLTYDQTGTFTWNDPYTGKSYEIPRFTATQTLSPEQQAIKEQTDAAQKNLAGLANQQSGFLQDYMSKPFTYDNKDAENWAYDLASQRILPQQQQNEEALRTKLLNSGIREGSAAWNSEMQRLTNANTDQLNQLALNGRQMGFQEAQAQRVEPINEITALLSGSQVSQPNYVNANMPTIPTTDVAGIINQDYQNRLGAYQQQQAGLGGLFSGIGSLAGGLIGLSDRRAKKDIKKRGEIDGMGIYDFKYKGGNEKHTGLMAQDVEKKRPGAVMTGPGGLKMVNYSKALGLMDL
jgi:hypothetical protein